MEGKEGPGEDGVFERSWDCEKSDCLLSYFSGKTRTESRLSVDTVRLKRVEQKTSGTVFVFGRSGYLDLVLLLPSLQNDGSLCHVGSY